MVVDSFACLLAMDAHNNAKFLPAPKIITDAAELSHYLTILKEQRHHVLEGAVKLFRDSLLSARNLPGNPRHLLGPMGSLQLWLGRIRNNDPHGIMLYIANISSLLGPAFPVSILEAVLKTLEFAEPVDMIAELERLESYGGFIRRRDYLRGEEVSLFARIIIILFIIIL